MSCISSSNCVAVGDYSNSNGTNDQTLIETWNGSTWTITSSPNTSATEDNYLGGVSCTSSSNCVAVGDSSNGTNDQTLIETWNGSTWTITSSPNTSATEDNYLGGVSCTSSSNCVAVGGSSNGTNDQTLIETWNGSTWTITSSPNTSATQSNDLVGVSCTSSSNCVAVGDYSNGVHAQTLIEMWNGSTWTITSSPPSAVESGLGGVSCTSPTDCVAVGDALPGTYLGVETVILIWNGTTWISASSPDAGLGYSLRGVSCSSPTDCVAVGDQVNDNNVETLIETWDGTTWTNTSSPNTSLTEDNELLGVSCISAGDCVAVGDRYDANGPHNQTLILSNIPPAPTHGYWLVGSDGGIFSFGTAQFFGSTGNIYISEPIVGMAEAKDGAGYWLVASDGGVFNFGDAGFYGSMGGKSLRAPIVGMAAAPDGGGYWLVASDGGIFSFGDAAFYGSMGGKSLNEPIVGMAADPTGGYWEVAADGGIFSFNAPYFGSTGSIHLNRPIVGMAAAGSGAGYWLVATDGGVFAEGGAPFYGSMGGEQLNRPVVAMAGAPDGLGYRLVASDGGIFTYGGAAFDGSMGGQKLNAPIIGMASS